MIKNLLIVGLCIVIGILIAYLFRPAPKPEIVGNLTIDQENELLANLVTLEGQNDSLRRELAKVATRDSVQREAHRKAVAPHKKVIATLEKDPEVIAARDSLPKIDSLLKAKDSVIVRHEDRIADLEHSAEITKQINEQLTANFEQRLAQTEQLLHDKEIENEQLSKENKKLRRKLVLTKITGVIILGGIIVLAL